MDSFSYNHGCRHPLKDLATSSIIIFDCLINIITTLQNFAVLILRFRRNLGARDENQFWRALMGAVPF